MTIGRRLFVLLTIPLAGLIGLGLFTGSSSRHRRPQPLRRGIADRGARHARQSLAIVRRAAGQRAQPHARLHARTARRGARTLRRRRTRGQPPAAGLRGPSHPRRSGSAAPDRIPGAEPGIRRGRPEVMSLADDGNDAAAVGYFEKTIGDVGVRLSEVSNEWIALDQQAASAAGADSVASIERFQRQARCSAGGVPRDRGARHHHAAPDRQSDPGARCVRERDCRRRLREGRAVRPGRRRDRRSGTFDRFLKRGAALMDEQRWIKSHVPGSPAPCRSLARLTSSASVCSRRCCRSSAAAPPASTSSRSTKRAAISGVWRHTGLPIWTALATSSGLAKD